MAPATQVDPDGFLFQVPLEIQKRVWGVEEFEAALSYVPIADGEDDLFAGLGSPAEADTLAVRRDLAIVHDGRATEEPQPEDATSETEHRHGDSSDTHVDEDGTDAAAGAGVTPAADSDTDHDTEKADA